MCYYLRFNLLYRSLCSPQTCHNRTTVILYLYIISYNFFFVILSFNPYSWDEFAKYDMPTMLQYVRKVTGVPILDYIGHSMGTTIFFVMMNYHPHINNWVSLSLNNQTPFFF